MPSKSPAQKRTMAAIAHGWRPTGSASEIPVKVAKEFFRADQRRKTIGKAIKKVRTGSP